MAREPEQRRPRQAHPRQCPLLRTLASAHEAKIARSRMLLAAVEGGL